MAVPNPTKKPTTAATGATTLQPVKAASIPDPLAKFGGRDAYVASQNKRWQDANASNNASLMSSLQADAKRVGYTLNPYNAPSTTTPSASPTPTSPYAEEYSQWKTKMNDALSNYEKLAGGSLSYDPNTDPKYQAMQTLAKQRAGAAKQSTMEDLNSRGILNSSVTASQLGQIEQAAEQEALAYIPQYEALARQDYQDRLSSAANLLNTYGGLADTAYNRDYTAGRDARSDMESDRNYNRSVLESDRAYDRNVLESDREYAYREARDAIADKQYKQQFDENVRQFGLNYALQQAQLDHQISNDNAQLAISRMNAATSRMNAENDNALGWARFNYEKSQDAAKGTTSKVNSNDIYAEAISQLDGMSPEQRKSFFTGEKANIIKQLGLSGYNQLYGQYFDDDGYPKQ